ncbi:MAG TPA: hypothetical protein VIL49_11940, partial [Capillimicrobium sp.]
MPSSAPAVLMFADTLRSADLRHVIPHGVHDPFLYLERGDERVTVLRSLEVARMSEVPGMQALPLEELGFDALVAEGRTPEEATLEMALAACRRFGVERATVPPDFPVAHADHLRAGGVELVVDGPFFAARRRAKTPAQLAGI